MALKIPTIYNGKATRRQQHLLYFLLHVGAFPLPSNWPRSVVGKPFFRLPHFFLLSEAMRNFGILFILVLKAFAYHNCLQLDGQYLRKHNINIRKYLSFIPHPLKPF